MGEEEVDGCAERLGFTVGEEDWLGFPVFTWLGFAVSICLDDAVMVGTVVKDGELLGRSGTWSQ